jgi:hypothetical protein
MRTALQEIIHLFEATRAREMHLAPTEHTLHDMRKLPAHLIDDVNAKGLPLDHRMPRAVDPGRPRPSNVSELRPRANAGGLRSV